MAHYKVVNTKAVILFICSILLLGCNQPSAKTRVGDKPVSKFNDSLVHELNVILEDDQSHREEIMPLIDKYGNGSEEVRALSAIINQNDYFNLIKVKAILDKYGWLGPEDIGTRGSSALFLVIQHSNIVTQKKYLPMMRQAVIDRKASGKEWALLEDRVALYTTGTQIYGSQIALGKGDSSYVSPIRDEINVNKRRKSIGLRPLEEYAKEFGITYHLPTK